jgi:predicted phage terminase large subunit-like protein
MVSDVKEQSMEFLSDIRDELEVNAKLAKDFPHVCGKGPIWRQDEIITRNSVRLISLGTGSKIRGRKFGVDRPSLVLLDDLENIEQVRSEAQRSSIRYDWFEKDVQYVGGEEGTLTDIFVVGTILGKDALLNVLVNKKEYPDWETAKFVAVEEFSDSPLWDDWRQLYINRLDVDRVDTARKFFEENKAEMLEGTKVLWPEGDPYYNLMVEKISNPSGFLSEKQNSPIDTSRILVAKDELHWENFKNPEIVKMLKRAQYFGALDPSVGKKKKIGDYSCIVTLARDTVTGYILVPYIWLKRVFVDDQIDAILEHHKHYNYKEFSIEVNAFQYVVAQTLRKKSMELGVYIPIKEINNYSDKKMRIEGIVPFCRDGTFVFDTSKYRLNAMYEEAITQLTTYTGMGDEDDDFPDALEQAFRIAKASRFKMLTRQTKDRD